MKRRCTSKASPDKFWAHVEQKHSGCWHWKGKPLKGKQGYGRLRVDGKPVRAHRWAFFLANGYLTEGLDVMHHCDNPICVNPAHLSEGTAHDNMRDMATRGRAAGFSRKKENHPLAKLTQDDVNYIKREYKKGHKYARGNGRELAQAFGLNYCYLTSLIRGNTCWK